MIRYSLSILAFRAALALAVTLLALSPQAGRAQTEQSIVVLVNDEPITNFDVAQRLRFFEVATKKKATKADREKVIEDLVVERIQLQEAKKAGVIINDDEVNRVFESMAKRNNMTPAQLTQALSQLGVNAKTLRDRSRAAIAWRGLVKRKFQHQVTVAAVDVDQALGQEEEGSKSKERTEFQLQRIYLELRDRSDQKAVMARLSEAEQIRSKFHSCDNLEELVKRVSRASSRDIGRKFVDDVPQPTRALLLAAGEGQMTPPNITASGIELYAICSRRSVKSDTDERRTVRAKLVNEEFQRLANGYLGDLRASAFVERPNDKK